MKNFYAEISISYSDNTKEEIYVGVENYTMTLHANSKKVAETQAEIEAKKMFDEEINEGFSNIEIKVEQCYETSDDARS